MIPQDCSDLTEPLGDLGPHWNDAPRYSFDPDVQGGPQEDSLGTGGAIFVPDVITVATRNSTE